MPAYHVTKVSNSAYGVASEDRGVYTLLTSPAGMTYEAAVAHRDGLEAALPAEPVTPVVAVPPRFAHQPGRLKCAKPLWYQHASRSKIREHRPRCPSCLEYMPPPGEDRDGWGDPFGHVDPRGEPCPSFRGLTPDTPAPRREPRVALVPVALPFALPENANGDPEETDERETVRRSSRRSRPWVQLLLVKTRARPVKPRVRRRRPAAGPSKWRQLDIDGWLAQRAS